MATTDIYGQSTDNGQAVVYQDAQGRVVEGVIRNLWPPIYKADLEIKYPDGATRFVEGAVYNDGPAPSCWKHAQGQDQAAASSSADGQAAQASEPAPVAQDDGQAASSSKKKGK